VTRALASALLFAAVLILAGCGGSEARISSTTALRDLKSAGFTELQIFRNTQANDRRGEIDKIGQPDVAMEFLPPVQLIDYASDKDAIDLYRQPYVRRWYEADVRAGQGLVPSNFVYSPAKAFSTRICNVILWSYNVDNDPRLRGRLDRAARSLRRNCA
jgi:hypothetical protein